MIKAVIFDLDNTLYDYDECDKYAMAKLRQFCVERFSVKENEFDAAFGRAKELVKRQLEGMAASHNRLLYSQRYLELLSQKPVVYALELYDTYWDAMLERMQPYSYVVPLFGQLAAKGIRIALLTDLTAHIQHRKIQRLGIADFVDVIVTSEEAGREKPNRGMFDLVMEKLGLPAKELLMIGDSKRKDIQGAEEVGIKGIQYIREMEGLLIKQCMEIIKNGI